jgi:uncharacterized alkaline shock family protein YloU
MAETMTQNAPLGDHDQTEGMSPAVQNPSPPAPNTDLMTEQGRTSIADSVVSKIAGVAAREVGGVHDMGTGASRMLGAIKERLPVAGDGPAPDRGVHVEVGERQAAVDLDIVVDYGVSIVGVADAIRQNVIRRVETMTGLDVTEVNISVEDVWLGDDDQDTERRVQ